MKGFGIYRRVMMAISIIILSVFLLAKCINDPGNKKAKSASEKKTRRIVSSKNLPAPRFVLIAIRIFMKNIFSPNIILHQRLLQKKIFQEVLRMVKMHLFSIRSQM